MKSSRELLKNYANDGDEKAFQEIVERHLNLVFSAALRIVGDHDLAREVSQIVFSDLARKAKRLPSDVVLSGWLYRDTTFVASKMVRTESRRMRREQQAASEYASNDAEENKLWMRIRPVVDHAISALREKDRDAVVLRFFEGMTFRETGQALGISEDAARMRVERALDKLKDQLGKLGVNSTSSALAKILTASAITLAPTGMASGVIGVALEGAGVGTLLTKLLTMTKLKTSLASLALAAGIATPIAIQQKANSELDVKQTELTQLQSQLQSQLNALREDNEALLNRQQIEEQDAERIRDERLELMKLRGEVGSLRLKVDEQAQQLAAIGEKPKDQEKGEIEQLTAFKTDVETEMKFGEVLITGGWKTAEGKRTYLLVYPELVSSSQIPGENENELIEQKMILVSGNVIEMTDDQSEESGFPRLNTESAETSFFELVSVENFEESLPLFFEKSDVRIMATPKTVTLSGEAASLQLGRTNSLSELKNGYLIKGGDLNSSLSVTFTPEVAEDNESLKLAVAAEWIRGK